jgi:uncharacterized tellurite resistance protein B-like protein
MKLESRLQAMERQILGDSDPLRRVMELMTAQELRDLLDALESERERRGETGETIEYEMTPEKRAELAAQLWDIVQEMRIHAAS